MIAYFHMWFNGEPAEAQCEGCTFFNGQVRELSGMHSRDTTYATFCQGPYEESVRYRDFMGWDVPWYSVEDSPEGWPRRWEAGANPFRTNGRPIAQWPRLEAGHSDDLDHGRSKRAK